MTILGDKAQTMDEDTQDVLAFLPKIFGKGIRTIEMNKSYRNTMEIAEYACKITGVTGIELFERHGKAVEEQHFPTLEEAVTAACNNLCLITDTSAYETAAILTYSQSQAEEVCRLLEEAGQEYHFIGRDSSTFKKGLSVSTFYLAKGLEFDQVFAVGTGERGYLLIKLIISALQEHFMSCICTAMARKRNECVSCLKQVPHKSIKKHL